MVVCARAAKREKGGRASCHNRLTAIASSLPFAFLMITFRRLPLTRWLLFGTHTHTCTQEARTTSNPSGTHERNYINNSPNSRLLDGMEQVHPTPQRLKQKLVSIEFSFRKKIKINTKKKFPFFIYLVFTSWAHAPHGDSNSAQVRHLVNRLESSSRTEFHLPFKLQPIKSVLLSVSVRYCNRIICVNKIPISLFRNGKFFLWTEKIFVIRGLRVSRTGW